MTQNITPNARDLTRGGTQSMLEGIFNERVAYDLIRQRILRRLDNDDFDALCSTSAGLRKCLLTPHHQQGPAGAPTRLRYQVDLIDRCDEILAPHRHCSNAPGSSFVNRRCNFASGNAAIAFNPHGGNAGRAPLICRGCKDHHHWTTSPAAIPHTRLGQSGHTVWRTILARTKISICKLCDREQRSRANDGGDDGCICYRELYERRWNCLSCDLALQLDTCNRKKHFQREIRSLNHQLARSGGQMLVQPVAVLRRPNEKPQWSCGRMPALAHPLPAAAPELRFADIPVPFLGTQHLEAMYPLDGHGNSYSAPMKLQHTKQCVLCCGYVVPPKRRSERVRRQRIARQEMQARADAYVNRRVENQAPTKRRSERVKNRAGRQHGSQAETDTGSVKPRKRRMALKRS